MWAHDEIFRRVGWRKVTAVKEVTEYSIPGDHTTSRTEHLHALVERLRMCLGRGSKGYCKQMSANISDTIWSTGPNELTLRRNEVHVWRTSLNVPASTLWTFEQTLSDDERVKAEKFKFAKDRFHFIISRGVLRTILGRYLQRNPQTLCFAYSHHGKPMLILEPDYELLNFSVTHSHTMALYAVTYYQDVGIDMECVQATRSMNK